MPVRIVCRATESGSESTPEASISQTEAGKTLPNERPNPQGLKMQKVERLGAESWAGVAAVNREKTAVETTYGKTALLVGGDLAFLLLFIAIGRNNHGESLDITSVFSTAAPFLLGWFGAADIQRAFGKEAQGGDVKAAAKKAGVVWATGIPVGIFVRSAQRGYLPDTSFVIVTLAVTLVFLVGWRSALAAVTANQAGQQKGKDPQNSNRKGNPFEFFQLLASLTKRW